MDDVFDRSWVGLRAAFEQLPLGPLLAAAQARGAGGSGREGTEAAFDAMVREAASGIRARLGAAAAAEAEAEAAAAAAAAAEPPAAAAPAPAAPVASAEAPVAAGGAGGYVWEDGSGSGSGSDSDSDSDIDMEAVRRLAASAQEDDERGGTLTDASMYTGCACCDPALRQQLEESLIRNGAIFNPEHDEAAVEEQLALLRAAAGGSCGGNGSGRGGGGRKTKRQGAGAGVAISLDGSAGGAAAGGGIGDDDDIGVKAHYEYLSAGVITDDYL